MNTTKGSSAFLALLADEGVSHLFGNPGTTELPIMDALARQSLGDAGIEYVLGLQESAVVAMADGFARASGRLAACNVHVAPGLGNAMGSLFNAHWIGSPLIVTAGQQEQGHGLMEPLLYGPLLPMASPVCKWSVEVTRLADLPRIVRRAAKVATTPPSGPVFISLPGDVLNDEGPLDLLRSTRVVAATEAASKDVERLVGRMLSARRPVLVCGAEVAESGGLEAAAALAEALGAPVYQQTVPHGAHFFSEHAAFMGALSRDQRAVRAILERHDLLIALGGDVLRMSVHSEVEPLPGAMPTVQIGLRDWELAKNYPVEIALRADVRACTLQLVAAIGRSLDGREREARRQRLDGLAPDNWSAVRERTLSEIERRTVAPAARDRQTGVDRDLLMLRTVQSLPRGAIVVDESLTSGRSLLKLLPFRDRHAYFGLGSGGIGFAIAGAIGVQLAHPGRPVTAIIGDGSAMYSIQALWTAAHLRLPITFVIANNRGYRILKERLQAFHGNAESIGMDFRSPSIDFAGLASAMGVTSERVGDSAALAPGLARAHEAARTGKGPTLLDVSVGDEFD